MDIKEMERIVVVSCKESPEAELWADYLISCFNKIMSQKARQHYKVMSMSIESITVELEDNPKVKQVSTAKLQILIMCPKLLQHISELEEASLDILKIFQTDKILTMLLGVTDECLVDVHQKGFPSYDQWQRMTVKADDTAFVDSFLATAVDILSKRLRTPTEKASFSIIPKKIKPGQNRVIALLNEPITNEDLITVRVDKKGEVLDINSFKKRNPYTLQFDVPDCCLEVSMLVWIKIEKNGVSCGSRQIKCESRLRELDQILRASENPLEFMCQTLGFKITDRDQLDNWMLTAFQRNIPPHFNLLSTPLQANMKTNSSSVDEYPTLLHFAARFGLERLCWQLMECPGGEAACDARNVRQLTPADLAQANGFTDLAAVLRGFVQMSEFSNMYYYLKNMSEEPSEAGTLHGMQSKILNTEPTRTSWEKFNSNNLKTGNTPLNTPDSNRSDPFSEECLQSLEAKHSHRIIKTPESPRVITAPKSCSGEWLYENDFHPMNVSITSQTSVQKALEHDYLIQPSNRKVENLPEISSPCRPQKIELNLPQKPAVTVNSPTVEKLPPFTLPPEFFEMKSSFMGCSAPKSKLSSSLSVSSKSSHDHQVTTPTGQDELAEIINDFKKNVFTISEVEKLVLDWRNRNETQQSLKEKQEQLNKMREEYDKLQRRIKDDMKRPTPFERVRKIFSKGKSKNGKNGTADIKPSGPRPNSGLSIHSVSSSSSGRLSTASGGSLGDSGTQSDNEDIKMFMEMKNIQKATPTSEHSIDSSAFDDYLIPPPPRPFIPSQAVFIGKNQPLPCIPGGCHTKQEYMIKTPPPMDTITENQIPAHLQDVNDGSPCSQAQNVNKNRFNMTNDVSDHQYMNMSPA